MAISQNTLIGSTKQSVGGVTFTKWKGRNVIKAKAVSVANPQTAAQTANRTRFAGVSKFYGKHKLALSLSFLRLMGNVTDGNMFNSMNRLFFSTDFVGVDTPMIRLLLLSSGSLGTYTAVLVNEGSGGHASVSYTYKGNPVKSAVTDMCRVLVYNQDKDVFVFSDQPVFDGQSDSVLAVTCETGNIIHAWVYSYSETGKLLSDSVYCGYYVAS